MGKGTKKKSLKINMLMNAILTMSGFIFPLISFPYVSRVLSPVGTGKVAFAISLVTYFSMFAQLGVPTYGIRACARVRDDKIKLSRTVQEVFLINAFMSVLAYIVFAVAIIFVPQLNQDKWLYIIVGLTIFFNTIGMEWLYRALEQFSYITACSLIFKTLAMIGMFLFIHDSDDYIYYGAISIFASSASNICNFINLRKHIIMKPLGNYNFRQHYKMIFTFFAMSIATTIYTNLDTVMLGFMKTDADVGYYNAAVKIKNILVSIVTAVSTVLLPRVSYFIEKGMIDEFKRIIHKTINFVIIISVPMTVYFMMFAKEGIFFLSGGDYAGSIVPMQIIMPTLICIGLTNVMGIQMLVPMNREMSVLYSEIAGAVVDLIINIVLIPSMGAAGAAIGTMVAEIVVLIWQYIVLKKDVKEVYRSIRYIVICIAVILAAAGSYWVKLVGIQSSFITLAISSICFFAIYFIVLLIFKESMAAELLGIVSDRIKKIVKK